MVNRSIREVAKQLICSKIRTNEAGWQNDGLAEGMTNGRSYRMMRVALLCCCIGGKSLLALLATPPTSCCMPEAGLLPLPRMHACIPVVPHSCARPRARALYTSRPLLQQSIPCVCVPQFERQGDWTSHDACMNAIEHAAACRIDSDGQSSEPKCRCAPIAAMRPAASVHMADGDAGACDILIYVEGAHSFRSINW